MNTTDSALLERWIVRRDPEAMALIVSRYSGMVYATCKRVTRNAADAEDIAQECFLKLSSVQRAGTSLAGLLHTMATRLSLNKARGDARRRAREADYTALQAGATEATWDDIQPLIDEAIAALPEGQSTVIIRHFLRGETHGEIADDLGLTRAAVSKRVAKGVEEVREALRRRGVIASFASLGAMLAAAGAEAAPMALTESLGRLAVSGAGRTGTHWAAAGSMVWGKLAVVIVMSVAGIGAFAWRAQNAITGADGEQRAAATAMNDELVGQTQDEDLIMPAQARTDDTEANATAVLDELPRGQGKLTAYVSDRTGLPAAGVAVTLAWENTTRIVEEGVSDSQGMLAIKELPWGKYLLRAVQGKFAARSAVTLSAEWPSARGELVLKPGGDIRGTVTGVDGAPVPGAAVQLMDAERNSEAPAMTETDETGAFLLEAIPLGQYRVRIVAGGFAPALTEEVRIDSAPLAIALSRGGTLEGLVRVASSGLPAPSVALKLSDPKFEGLERNITTDEHGRFLEDTLPAGPCYVVSTDERYAFNPVRAEVVLANDRVERAEFTLEEGAQVSGTITDGATGEPLAWAVVVATDQPSRTHYWKSAPTGPDGRYHLSGLAAGACQVIVQDYPPLYSTLGDDVRELLQLQPGEVRERLNFQFYQGALVEGVVVDEAGAPVPRAKVELELIRRGENPLKRPFPLTDATGSFFFANIGLAGAADDDLDGVLDLRMEGAMVALRAIYRDTRSEYMGPMELPSGGIHGITLRLESAPSGAIGGYAVDGFGEPAKALIMLDRIDAPHRGSSGGQCEVDGFFLESNLESGSYGLRVVPSDDYERIIELAEGQRITDLRVVVSGVLKITGRVTDAEGRPVDGADVSAMVPGAELDSGSTFTDGDGRFVLEVLEEGKYSILVYVRGLDGASWQGTATTGDYIEIEMAPPSDQETDPEQ
jgi:RNA polymerase sigma factor (sigma-70 family)